MNQIGKRRAFVGLYRRMLIGYTVIILLVFGIACGVTYNLVRGYILSGTKEELLEKAEFIASGERKSPDWKVLRKYQSLLDAEIVYVDRDYVAVHSPSKTSLKHENESTDTELSYTAIASQMDQKIIDSVFNGNHVTGVEQVDFLTAQIVYAGVPIYNSQNQLQGAMLLIRTVKDVNLIWLKILFYAFVSIAGAMLVAILFSSIFARSLAKPIMSIREAAKTMMAGDYRVRVPVACNDEIGELANTINVLAARLQEVICSLKNEKTKIEQILFSIAEGIVAFDRNGQVLQCNPAALELLEIDEWDGCDCDEMKSRKRNITDLLILCMKTGKNEVSTWTSASGRAITAIASRIENGEAEMIGAVCLLRDVSEEQRLEQLRKEYIANVSHELRTPLTGIRGMVEPLIDDVLDTEEEKKNNYRIIYRETLRLEKLIGEMLDLSRLQDGRVRVDVEPMNPACVARRAVASMKNIADEAGVNMILNAESGIVCMGNEDRAIQTLVILIDNAVSFTPVGGTVTVSVREDGEKAYLSVRDTGAGIEPQHLPYIWERFYKADKSRMRTTGTGLGLAIAKRVVELMGGEIGVKTEVGKGAEFTVSLKLAGKEEK